ncbi:conserved hypothetical protein [Culex quinquefasciatus]|uniref:Ionotropic glutamate receptor L-glutamate and glycine-binding domain-containing protein n=1 Tax=Culex quinquefasciatus TaxID=7176 RepID=B0WAX5_CULQU|nr:conserved hypothetical protein [Culex quinquefasciatus]|eukprot:XP_001845859.1 conserved hypothetical protein [Culex quinquefasciatus]
MVRNPLVPNVQRAEIWHFEAGLVDFLVQELIQHGMGCPMIPRRVLYYNGSSKTLHPPAVLVLFSKNYSAKKLQRFFSSDLNWSLKVIVLYHAHFPHELQRVISDAQLHHVIYIRTSWLVIQQKLPFRDEIVARSEPIPFEETFADPIGNLTGQAFAISYATTPIDSLWNIKTRNGYGTDLLEDTIQRLGGRTRLHRISCENEISVTDCYNKSFFYNATTMYDFGVMRMTRSHVRNEHFTYSIIPITMAVAAPTGLKLTSFEVFVIPFKIELWVSLFVMIAICIAMMRLFPKQFHNDLILLPICGFERRQFHQVSSLEKATLVTLIIVYYILFNAYEAKIIAFMTNFPYASDPHTLHDLLQSNVTIQNFDAGFETMMITEDPRMRQLFAKPMARTNSSIEWNSRDRAYIGSRPYLQFIMSDAKNYDPETGRRRLVILDRFTLGNRVGFVFTSYRNPLAKMVQRVEMQHFEAGMMDHWLKRHIQETFGVRHVDFVAKGFATTRNTIGIVELEPAWCALAIGWMIAGIVLISEMSTGIVRLLVLRDFEGTPEGFHSGCDHLLRSTRNDSSSFVAF